MLRLTASLLLGRVPATGIMRTLQVGDSPTSLANGIAELGRADKALHMLRMLDNEEERRSNLTQLNRGEGRHSMARALFHGKLCIPRKLDTDSTPNWTVIPRQTGQ